MVMETREKDIWKELPDPILYGHSLEKLEIRPLGIFYLGRFLHGPIGHLCVSTKPLLQGVGCEDAFLLYAYIDAYHSRTSCLDFIIPCNPEHLVSVLLSLWRAHGAVRFSQSDKG